MHITSSVAQDGVHMLSVSCLSLYRSQTMNYALLNFQDVNGVNVFAF